MAAVHAIRAETTSQKPPQRLKQYSLQECCRQYSSLWVYEGLCAFSLGLVVPRWADLRHFHHTEYSIKSLRTVDHNTVIGHDGAVV
jgi:hypothetical protein